MYQDLGDAGHTHAAGFCASSRSSWVRNRAIMSFQPYAYQTMDVKYFDTKSPYTDMYIALGGNNQNILRFDMAQNINPRWNVGFDVQRFTVPKTVRYEREQ